MIRIKENKILVYIFFQIFVLSANESVVGSLIPVIASELNIGLDFIGSAISLSIFGIFLVSLTAGNLIELFGLKKMIFTGTILGFFGSFGLFLSNTFTIFIIAYFLLHLGIGVILICILSIVGNYYSGNKASSLIKIKLGRIGALIISPLLVSLILFLKLDWRYFFIITLVFQLALIIILLVFKIPRKIEVGRNFKTLFVVNKKIISNFYFILCSIIVFLFAPIADTFFTWFTSYFLSLNISIKVSSLFLSSFGLSIFAGMLFKIKLVKIFQEKRILLFSFILSFFLLIGILLIDNLVLKNILIFLFGFNIAGNFAITFSISSELFSEYANSISGLLIAFTYLGIMFFQYLSGYLSEHFSKDSVLYINIVTLFILVVITSILNFTKISKHPAHNNNSRLSI